MRIFDLAMQTPWLCTEATLQLILEIAARERMDVELARALKADRAARWEAVALTSGRPLDGTRSVVLRDGVAIVPIHGPLVRRADLFSDMSGGASTETLAQDFQRALNDPAVDAILLDIDSPGGEATGINELAQHIYAARETKPLTAYVDGMGASAAYWLASACDTVVCDPTAALGSIGAVMAVWDPAKRDTKQIAFVSSQSPNKRPDPHTERGRASYQRIVDDLAEVFIESVARNRGVSTEVVQAEFGGGDLLIGRHAVDAGLADQLGSFEGTLAGLQQAIKTQRATPARLEVHVEENHMRISEVWRGFFAAAREEGIPIEDDTTPEPSVATGERTDELAQLRAQLATAQRAQREQAAAAFADAAVQARRAIPAERASLLALYLQAADDDAARPTPQGIAPRTEQLAALINQRPQHQLTSELVRQGGELRALPTGEDAGELEAQGRAQAQAYATSQRRNGSQA